MAGPAGLEAGGRSWALGEKTCQNDLARVISSNLMQTALVLRAACGAGRVDSRTALPIFCPGLLMPRTFSQDVP